MQSAHPYTWYTLCSSVLSAMQRSGRRGVHFDTCSSSTQRPRFIYLVRSSPVERRPFLHCSLYSNCGSTANCDNFFISSTFLLFMSCNFHALQIGPPFLCLCIFMCYNFPFSHRGILIVHYFRVLHFRLTQLLTEITCLINNLYNSYSRPISNIISSFMFAIHVFCWLINDII